MELVKVNNPEPRITPQGSEDLQSILSGLQKDLNSLDFQQIAPPVICQFFTIHRELAYSKLEKLLEDKPEAERDKFILQFIRKIDLEMLPEFKKKIKNQYILKILSKDYNMPEQIDLVAARKYDLNSELAKLAEHVTGWSIELELLTDLLSSLELYGIINLENKKEGFLKFFKREFRPKHVNDLRTSADFLLRNAASYSLKQVSRVMLLKGINTSQMTAPLLMKIFSDIMATKVIPWASMLQLVSFPWLLGSFGLYFGLSKIASYLARDEIKEKISNCDESLVEYKLFIREKRGLILELIQEYFEQKTERRSKEEVKEDIQKQVGLLFDESQIESLIAMEKLTKKNEEDIGSEMWQMLDGSEDYTVVAQTKYVEEEKEGFVVVDKV